MYPNTVMRHLGATFLKGLVAILPIIVTLYLIYWLATLAESVLGGLLDIILPFYFPGLGLIAAIVGIFLLGVLLNAWLVRKLFVLGDALMHRIPLVKSVYGAVEDLMRFFSTSSDEQTNQVVAVKVTVGGAEARLLGLITREDFKELPPELGGPGDIAVYLPMSYQLGGYTLLLPRDQVTPVNLTIDQAMRFAVTAGMSTRNNNIKDISSNREQT
ncbi:MAG: DUF502 domain-containing protein [Aquisalimonadaceae bacterium]